MRIEGNRIVADGRCFVVAEVGQAHDGSVGYAHAFIDIAARCNVDAVKFQAHFAMQESTKDEEFRVNFSYVDKDRFSYWERMELSPTQLLDLKKHAESLNLVFICTPFSPYAVDILDDMDICIWKIGSGEAQYRGLLDKVIRSGKPLLFSTGMSSFHNTDEVVELIQESGLDFVILQCTSKYPTPIREVGIDTMVEYRKRYGCRVGLSDHSGSIWPSIYAMAAGADLVEVHIKMDDLAFGPDSTSSLLPKEVATICDARDNFEMLAKVDDKDEVSKSLASTRMLFSRSITLNARYTKGTVIDSSMILMRKPGNGISESEIDSIIGSKLTVDYDPLYLLKESDISRE